MRPPASHRYTRRLTRDDGGIVALTAIMLSVVLVAGAVAVDTGRAAATSRDLQGAADRAALDAVLALADASDPLAAATTAAADSLARNPGPANQHRQLAALDVGLFDLQTGWITDPTDPHAVAVDVEATVRSWFLPGERHITRHAVARQERIATIAAATSTASITTTDADILNGLLGGLIGTTVGLDVVGWQGIVTSNVNLAALAAELGVGTAEQLAATTLGVGELPAVVIAAIERDGGTASAGLEELAMTVPPLPDVVLGDVLDLAAGDPALRGDVNVADLLFASSQSVTAGSSIGLGAGIPGVVDADLTVVEPPKIAVGRATQDDDGVWVTAADAAQTRLDVAVPITGSLSLGTPGLSVQLADELNVSIETGAGSVAITGIDCTAPGQVTTDGQIDAARVRIEEFNLVRLNLLGLTVDVTANADVEIGGDAGTLVFDGPFPSAPQRLGATNPGLTGVLLDGLQIDIDGPLGGLGLSAGQLTNAIEGLLEPVLTSLDATLDTLLRALSVQLGALDVHVIDLDCLGRSLAE